MVGVVGVVSMEVGLCNGAVKQNSMISIFRKLGSLIALEHEATILQHAPSR